MTKSSLSSQVDTTRLRNGHEYTAQIDQVLCAHRRARFRLPLAVSCTLPNWKKASASNLKNPGCATSSQVADRALAAFLAIQAALRRSAKLGQFSYHPGLLKRFKVDRFEVSVSPNGFASRQKVRLFPSASAGLPLKKNFMQREAGFGQVQRGLAEHVPIFEH